MKKRMALVLSLLLLVLTLSGCGAKAPEKTEDDLVVRVGALKGPTSIGMVKLLDNAEKGTSEGKYSYQLAATADELTPLLLKGELDILAVPSNLGSTLYANSNGAVQVIAVNALGVLYITEKNGEEIASVSDLKGQTILATGKGTVTEYVLRYLLKQNGIDPDSDVTMEWKSENAEIVTQMATEDHAIAMLPQPYVTVAQGQVEGLAIALDLTKEWDALHNGSRLTTASVIVRKAFAQELPDAVKTFLKELKESVAYVTENVEESAGLVERFGITKAPVAKQAIPYCNLVCLTGNDMKTNLEAFLSILHEENPKAVGGALPAEDYYLIYE